MGHLWNCVSECVPSVYREKTESEYPPILKAIIS